MQTFGVALFAFLLFIQALVIRANFLSPPRLHVPTMLCALAVLLVFCGIWTIRMYRSFAVIPSERWAP